MQSTSHNQQKSHHHQQLSSQGNRVGSWGVQRGQWSWAFLRYGPKKNYSPVVLLSTTPLKKIIILFLSDTTCSITITPSDFPFLLPRFDFLFLFCCLVLGLLELDPLAFGVSWVFFWEGGLRFLMYTVVIFTFRCIAYIQHLVFIF